MQNTCVCNERAGLMNLCKAITEIVIFFYCSVKGHLENALSNFYTHLN